MNNSQIKENKMSEPVFNVANIPVKEAARALKMDCQSVRILLQQGLVGWGTAFKHPGSHQFSYLISPRKFWLETGFIYGGEADE